MNFIQADKQRLLVGMVLLTGFLTYSFYLYAALPVKVSRFDQEADSGKLVWQKYNCNACHQVYGLGGYLGPDLTNVYSIKGSPYIQAFLKNGTNIMPDFHLSDTEIRQLTGFMKNIDASGKSDPKTFTLNYNGTIEQ